MTDYAHDSHRGYGIESSDLSSSARHARQETLTDDITCDGSCCVVVPDTNKKCDVPGSDVIVKEVDITHRCSNKLRHNTCRTGWSIRTLNPQKTRHLTFS
jgi:hypothetical protein